MTEEREGIAMTEKESLEKALVLWKRIAEKGHKNKFQAYEELGLSLDVHYCPACQFAMEVTIGPGTNEYNFSSECCQNCPIWEWQEGGFMCERGDSSYAPWRRKQSPETAQKMVKLVEKILAGGPKEDPKEDYYDQD